MQRCGQFQFWPIAVMLLCLSNEAYPQWTQPSQYAWNSVFPLNSSTAWAASSRGEIFKTTDGGASWTTQMSGANLFWSIFFLDANIGWAVGKGGSIRKTTNGGSTWNAQTSGVTFELSQVFFVNANNGWIVQGDGGNTLWTTNGGTTWTTVASGVSAWLKSIHFFSTSIGWLCGDGPTIRKTTNGGLSWFAQTVPPLAGNGSLTSIFFVNQDSGWCVGGWYSAGNRYILRTTNGGTVWTIQKNDLAGHIQSVCFQNSAIGAAVGYNGSILQTTNGGTNWTTEASPVCVHLNCVRGAGSSMWAVGIGGIILLNPYFPTDVLNSKETVPAGFVMKQNYPNPFNPSTTITFELPHGGNVQVSVYNSLGQLIRSLVDEQRGPGSQSVVWDGRDNVGSIVASGTYFYQVQIGDLVQVKKMLLLK